MAHNRQQLSTKASGPLLLANPKLPHDFSESKVWSQVIARSQRQTQTLIGGGLTRGMMNFISLGQCFSSIIHRSLFKSKLQFISFSKSNPARFPWFNCIFFVWWQWKAEENILAKEMKYYQEQQAFSHYRRWFFISYKKKIKSLYPLNEQCYQGTFTQPKVNVGKKAN